MEKLEKRNKFIKAYVASFSEDDLKTMTSLYDDMSLTVLKHDGWEDESQQPLESGTPSIDQAFKLAAYICSGNLAEEVTDNDGKLLKINMQGPLSVFVKDA